MQFNYTGGHSFIEAQALNTNEPPLWLPVEVCIHDF